MAMKKDLFRWCKKINLDHQRRVYRIPWFKRELDAFDDCVNDEKICSLVCNSAKKITLANPFYYEAHHVAATIYEDVYGSEPDFLIGNVDEYELLDENEKQLFEVLDQLPIDMRLQLVRNSLFLKSAEKRGPVTSFIGAYYAFEDAFFEMIHKRYKHSKNINKQDWYLVFHKIANKYCYLVFDDPSVWRERLTAKLS